MGYYLLNIIWICLHVKCDAVLEGHYSDVVPLGCKDSVEDGAVPAVSCGLQDKHILDDVEGETIIRKGTEELGFKESGPFLLQHPLTTFITLPMVQIYIYITTNFGVAKVNKKHKIMSL